LALCDDFPEIQHRDGLGDSPDESDVVVDHQDRRPVSPQPEYDLGELVHFAVGHSGGRLVEHQHTRPEDGGAGDLYLALQSVREVFRQQSGHVLEAEQLDGRGAIAFRGSLDVLGYREVAVKPDVLEGAGQAEPDASRRGFLRQVDTAHADATGIRRHDA
jgi:hypothetical protein